MGTPNNATNTSDEHLHAHSRGKEKRLNFHGSFLRSETFFGCKTA